MKKLILLSSLSLFIFGCNMNPNKEARIQDLESEIQQIMDKAADLEGRVQMLESTNEELEARVVELEASPTAGS